MANTKAKPLVSVILCCYNCASRLEKCLNSLESQTYKELQYVLINDGSTDDTERLLLDFAKDKNAVYACYENSGIATARNRGLSKVTGEYFTFIDADDIVSPIHIENLVESAEKYGAEVSVSGFIRLKDKKASKYRFNLNKKAKVEEFSKVDAMKQYFSQNKFDYVLWNKLYKTETLRKTDARFLDGSRYGEETLFIYEFFKGIKKAVYSPKITYIYVQNGQSLMHQEFSERRLALYDNIDKYIGDCKESYPEVYPYVCSMRSGYSCGMLFFMKRSGYKNAKVVKGVIDSLFADAKQLKKCKKTSLYRRLFIPLVPKVAKLLFKKLLKTKK